MRKCYLLVVILISAVLAANAAWGQDGWSAPNTFGGQNWYAGSIRGYSTPNVFGGQDYRFGDKTWSSRHNVFGGYDWDRR